MSPIFIGLFDYFNAKCTKEVHILMWDHYCTFSWNARPKTPIWNEF